MAVVSEELHKTRTAATWLSRRAAVTPSPDAQMGNPENLSKSHKSHHHIRV